MASSETKKEYMQFCYCFAHVMIKNSILRWCSCFPIFRKKRNRYGYTIIREPIHDSHRLSLLSNVSQDNKPIPNHILEEFEDHQQEIIQCMKELKTTRILLEIPALGRRLTSQLAEYSFEESGQYVNVNLVADEREEILKQNLVYLASHTENVDKLASELMTRRVLTYSEFLVVSSLKNRFLKTIEIFKVVLNHMDSLAFLIAALKVTGSDYVAEILVGNYFPEAGAELVCRISLSPEFSPVFTLHGYPVKYRTLYPIPIDRQEVLTAINCTYIEFKGKTLLNSLKYASNLTSIKLKDVKLKQEFRHKISLPLLREFVLDINQDFATRKDLYDFITPKRVLSMLFFISDDNNNHRTSQSHSRIVNTDADADAEEFDFTFDFADSNTTDRWNINDLWKLNIDISLKIGGRTILHIDHVKSRLFSRVENYYKIPENICQPEQVRNLNVGWCVISKSFIPLHVTRLHLYCVKFIESSSKPNSQGSQSCREHLNVMIRNLVSLRELKVWGEITAQPWPIIRMSNIPQKLKSLAASFVEIQIESDDEDEDENENDQENEDEDADQEKHEVKPGPSTAALTTTTRALTSVTNLESICLFIYEINEHNKKETSKENQSEKTKSKLRLKFLDCLNNCKKVSLINFPPFQQPTQRQLLELIQLGKSQQILLSGCQHKLNFTEHYLYFKEELIANIEKTQSFLIHQEKMDEDRWVWKGKPQSKEEVIQHLYFKFGFEELYSPEAFLNHEIIASLWKYFS